MLATGALSRPTGADAGTTAGSDTDAGATDIVLTGSGAEAGAGAGAGAGAITGAGAPTGPPTAPSGVKAMTSPG
ncbi:hypothetical protein AS032_35185 [Rhodococcus qingshengii]|nr:hypothetical protein AS032_35185 [Rhodococcus qingshengii]